MSSVIGKFINDVLKREEEEEEKEARKLSLKERKERYSTPSIRTSSH